MRSTVDIVEPVSPPLKYPKFEFPVAANPSLAKLNGPLTDAVAVSLE